MHEQFDEVWLIMKSSLTHLRVFGSLYFKHNYDAKRKKLEDKNEPLTIVGYHGTDA